MDQREFCRLLYTQAVEVAVKGEIKGLEDPPGRAPRHQLVELSQWYRGLTVDDQLLASKLLRMGAEAAVFGVLAMLDGVRSVRGGDGEPAELELIVDDGDRVTINDPSREMLHDLFAEIVHGDT